VGGGRAPPGGPRGPEEVGGRSRGLRRGGPAARYLSRGPRVLSPAGPLRGP